MHRLRRYSLPYLLWMSVFILVPTLFLVFLAVSDASLYQLGAFSFTLANFRIFSQDIILRSLQNSFGYAFLVSIVSFIIGYPVAYTLTKLPEKTKRILIALMILPLWTNMLVRITAWERIFSANSIFTDVFGVSIPIIGTELAVFLGLLAMYLPFMIFPIFSVLDKLDPKLIEAAKDLGATDTQTFVRVVFPLSLGGVVSGFIMTFLPSLTAFALPETLGWRKVPMIGMEIQKQFLLKGFEPLAVNQGALISLLIMLFSIASFVLITRVDKEGETLI
jgi:spermidine/putrescine transport system permease protein